MEKTYLLYVSLPLISAILSITFFCLWLMQKSHHYILNWALSFGCGLVGATVGLARLFWAETAVFSFLGNGFLAGVAYFACRGAMLRHTGQAADHLLLPIYMATLFAGLWFGFVEPSIFGRGAATSVGAASMLMITAIVMWQAEERDVVAKLTAVGLGATALLLTARPILVYFIEGTIANESDVTDSWWGISFRFLAMLSFVAVAILFLHRIATDLMNDLKVQAHTDYLTGVLNRGGFFARAKKARKHYTTFTVIMCDIDGFKDVNDTHGHAVGDAVIQSLARIIAEAADPAGYIVGRLGGDEFTILLPDVSAAEAKAFAEQICSTFAMTTHRGIAPSDKITISAGVAASFGSEPVDRVIEQADGALYRAKLLGKNRAELVASPMADRATPIMTS